MKSFAPGLVNNDQRSNNTAQVTELLIDRKRGHKLVDKQVQVNTYNGVKGSSLGQKGHSYKGLSFLSNDDIRSQSLPNGVDEITDKLNCNVIDQIDNCDTHSELLTQANSHPNSPTSEWFKTWPERYDKYKTNESNVSNSINKSVTDISKKNVKNKVTLNEALQNISLAYSPVTKQLHLLKEHSYKNEHDSATIDYTRNEDVLEMEGKVGDVNYTGKPGHRRTEAGSFSSTVSTLSGISDPSPSGSLLGPDERSISSLDISNSKPRRKSLTNFFTRNAFPWKLGAEGSNVWKIFSKHSNTNFSVSPIHVASSSALIQHERPSNLPAKTLEEVQKHRDEYKAILAAAKKKQAQNTAAKQKQQKIQLQMEEQQAAAAKHFSQHVLPNWDFMRTNKKTLDLWWQGLPSSVRGKVWRLAIGNELNLTPQLYEICLCRAQNRLNSPELSQYGSDLYQESSMDVIQLDISRTFPHLCIFQEGGPYSDTLHSLLAAYVCYRPDVGYVQGMSYIAAILILNMEPYDAFICFANILNQPLHLSAFTLNQTQMQAYYNAYNQVFTYNLPKLYTHFEKAGLSPDLYLLDWIYTIFAKAMPLDIACRIWDIFLRDGYEFIFRTALGILHMNQDILMGMDFLHGAQFLTHLPDDISSDQLFKSIQLVSTSIGKQTFNQIVDKCSFPY